MQGCCGKLEGVGLSDFNHSLGAATERRSPERASDDEFRTAWSCSELRYRACLLFASSVVLFSQRRSLSSWLQCLGAAGLIVVVLTLFAEALDPHPMDALGIGR